ncbi:hypothetical protein XELAEV_18036223mg [Xenopus laevis]|uniref:Uncharacterized protein n=1 Tax=Xenopus laevis TaxID=8355 RepID=A0A974CHG8_XENLA|nr:hypothetical protein XELAEV_18036223mg [Xenopus laevis]
MNVSLPAAASPPSLPESAQTRGPNGPYREHSRVTRKGDIDGPLSLSQLLRGDIAKSNYTHRVLTILLMKSDPSYPRGCRIFSFST